MRQERKVVESGKNGKHRESGREKVHSHYIKKTKLINEPSLLGGEDQKALPGLQECVFFLNIKFEDRTRNLFVLSTVAKEPPVHRQIK